MSKVEELSGGGYLEGARAVLPLALATGLMGVSFGVLAYAAGGAR